MAEPPLPPALPSGLAVAGHPRPRSRRVRATVWLLSATGLWGLSFPLTKTLLLAQFRLLPGADSWFLSALGLVFRFGVAAAVMALFSLRTLRGLTRLELTQGVGLGVFAAGGMLFQMDGLNYTAASTSAFLTSCYCVLAAGGIGVLAGVDWRALRLGRGESETVVSSLFFAAQIFWLERPAFARNRTSHATVVMFAVLAALSTPLLWWRMENWAASRTAAFGSPAIVACLLALTLLCTLATFTVMNHWQRDVEATEAGLIYCAEPLWTSVFALFLPAWLAAWTGTDYANETPTVRLLVGGGLITAANVCIQWRPKAVTPVR